ncbi:hypothetical protein ANCCAN_01261 [Ancylostoma caninum]|uniref:Uncharacterized protein n=1 Tax=Ancylostoma caninum TaxID=29170 RepID=A0A368H7J7_ANCCA|nr:hypothetical protein ANCCAN_01261 [Ancylostoma caninum]
MGIFKSCCGCQRREQDSEPYETARCTQSTLSPAAAANSGSPQLTHAVQNEEAKAVATSEDRELKAKKDKELTFTVSTPSQPLPVGSTGQLFSILEAHSFNPPLCSTKIGEGTPTKCSSLSAIETTASKRNGDHDYVTHSLLSGEQDKSKYKARASRPLRRMTIASPLNLNNSSKSEFDCSKMVFPEYRPLSKVPDEGSGQENRVSGRFKVEPTKNRASCTYVTCEDGHVRMSCISTSTAYSRSHAPVQFMEFAKAMAENDRAFEKNMAEPPEDEVDVEMPRDDVDSKHEVVESVLSLTADHPASSAGASQVSLGDGYRLLDGSAKPLSPEESAQFYAVPPPNTPIETAPKEPPVTPTAVKIRGGAAYYSAHL